MAKNKKSAGVKVEACVCSKCGQKSNAAPHSQHAFCRGFKLLKPIPPMFADLRKPVKGFWEPVIKMGSVEIPIPVEVVAN